MQTGLVLTEMNKLVTYAKWSDEQLSAMIENYIGHEDPEFSPLPEMLDDFNSRGVDASSRVDDYLDSYFSLLDDNDKAILVYLAGELPERDASTLQEGNTVYWLDPDDHHGNGWYTISHISAGDECPINDDTIITIRNPAGSEAEVTPDELR